MGGLKQWNDEHLQSNSCDAYCISLMVETEWSKTQGKMHYVSKEENQAFLILR